MPKAPIMDSQPIVIIAGFGSYSLLISSTKKRSGFSYDRVQILFRKARQKA